MIESEKNIEKRLVNKVKAAGGMCIKIPATFSKGIPDRLCLFPGGRVAFVELKTTGKKPSDIQLWWHGRLQTLGFRIEVIDSSEGVDKFVKDYAK